MSSQSSTGSAQADTEAPVRHRLRAALPAALKARDRAAVSALRSALAAIENAEAVGVVAPGPGSLAIEETPLGVGAADVERRTLTAEQVEAIVRAEVAEREAAADGYHRAGHPERAELLRREAATLAAHLDAAAPPPA